MYTSVYRRLLYIHYDSIEVQPCGNDSWKLYVYVRVHALTTLPCRLAIQSV